jgi:hypothetical protein
MAGAERCLGRAVNLDFSAGVDDGPAGGPAAGVPLARGVPSLIAGTGSGLVRVLAGAR